MTMFLGGSLKPAVHQGKFHHYQTCINMGFRSLDDNDWLKELNTLSHNNIHHHQQYP